MPHFSMSSKIFIVVSFEKWKYSQGQMFIQELIKEVSLNFTF